MSGTNYIKSASQNACAEELASLDRSYRREVMAQLCFDRIAQKQDYIVERFHDTDNWNETAYFMLMRALDIGANRKLYEQLARIVTYRHINLVAHNRRSIEALLLGCAGLLPKLSDVCGAEESEIADLKSIYEYDSYKYGLEQMDVSAWQLTGHYGDNHPIVRLLQVANILSQHEHLLESLLKCRTKRDVENIFRRSEIPSWAHRFLSLEAHSGKMSYDKAYMLGINVVAQMQIFYSEFTMREDLNEQGLDLLEQLPAENNGYVRKWARYKCVAQNALESQALLQLSTVYCHSLACGKCFLRRFIDSK